MSVDRPVRRFRFVQTSRQIMKTSLLPLLAASLLCSVAFGAEQPIFPALKGALVSVQGKSVKKFNEAPLAQTKYFGLYFSASWCPPCRLFTPKLVEFYNRTKPAHPEFELIFVSSDRDEGTMEAYMEKDKMPWPALRYSKIRHDEILTSYSGEGIPCLVFVDASGKVLSDSYEGGRYVGPEKVVADIERILGGTAPATGALPESAKSPGTNATGAPGRKTDDFSKKK